MKTTLLNKIESYNEWKALLEEAKKELTMIENEIKEEMTERNLEEIHEGQYIIKYIDILSSRFDTKRFKEEQGESLYREYLKEVPSKRFTVSA